MIEGWIVLDQRGGSTPHWVTLPKGVKRLMQVPDEIRKAVVFLYCRVKGEMKAAGTAFYARYPLPDFPESGIDVLMTAQHVIAAIRENSDDGLVVVRLNLQDGGSELLAAPVDNWLPADQSKEAVDLAVTPWRPPPGVNVDMRPWRLGDSVATDDVMRREGIGIGDEVFMVGLFRNHLGRDRNEPIIRVGNLAAIPADPIRTKHFGDMRAFLVEARSIGGLSGSPVFAHMGLIRVRDGAVHVANPEVSPGEDVMAFYFLGLAHGHWSMPEADADDLLEDVREDEVLHTGIAAVVPAQQIMNVLHPLLEEPVKVFTERLRNESAPVEDSLGDGTG